MLGGIAGSNQNSPVLVSNNDKQEENTSENKPSPNKAVGDDSFVQVAQQAVQEKKESFTPEQAKLRQLILEALSRGYLTSSEVYELLEKTGVKRKEFPPELKDIQEKYLGEDFQKSINEILRKANEVIETNGEAALSDDKLAEVFKLYSEANNLLHKGNLLYKIIGSNQSEFTERLNSEQNEQFKKIQDTLSENKIADRIRKFAEKDFKLADPNEFQYMSAVIKSAAIINDHYSNDIDIKKDHIIDSQIEAAYNFALDNLGSLKNDQLKTLVKTYESGDFSEISAQAERYKQLDSLYPYNQSSQNHLELATIRNKFQDDIISVLKSSDLSDPESTITALRQNQQYNKDMLSSLAVLVNNPRIKESLDSLYSEPINSNILQELHYFVYNLHAQAATDAKDEILEQDNTKKSKFDVMDHFKKLVREKYLPLNEIADYLKIGHPRSDSKVLEGAASATKDLKLALVASEILKNPDGYIPGKIESERAMGDAKNFITSWDLSLIDKATQELLGDDFAKVNDNFHNAVYSSPYELAGAILKLGSGQPDRQSMSHINSIYQGVLRGTASDQEKQNLKDILLAGSRTLPESVTAEAKNLNELLGQLINHTNFSSLRESLTADKNNSTTIEAYYKSLEEEYKQAQSDLERDEVKFKYLISKYDQSKGLKVQNNLEASAIADSAVKFADQINEGFAFDQENPLGQEFENRIATNLAAQVRVLNQEKGEEASRARLLGLGNLFNYSPESTGIFSRYFFNHMIEIGKKEEAIGTLKQYLIATKEDSRSVLQRSSASDDQALSLVREDLQGLAQFIKGFLGTNENTRRTNLANFHEITNNVFIRDFENQSLRDYLGL